MQLTPRQPVVHVGQAAGGAWSWRPAAAANPHLLVSGTTGAGKSVLLRALAARVEREGVPVLVLDMEGDWRGTRATIDGIDGALNLIDVAAAGDERALRRLELADALAAGADLGPIQHGALRDALAALPPGANHHDLVEALPAGAVRVRLAPLAMSFRASAGGRIEDLVSTGGVIDLSRVPRSVRALAAVALLSRVYNIARGWPPVERGIRLVVIIDEAHTLSGRPLRQLLETQVREARKRGLALWFGTQSGDDLGDRVPELLGSVALLRQRSSGKALAALGAADQVELPCGRIGRLADLRVGEAAWWVPGQGLGVAVRVEAEGADLPAQLDARWREIHARRRASGVDVEGSWTLPEDLAATVAAVAGGRAALEVGRWALRLIGPAWRVEART